MSAHDATLVPSEYVNPIELRNRIVSLEKAVLELRADMKAQPDALRHVLAAMFRQIANELSGTDVPPVMAGDASVNSKWAAYKARLSPRAGEVIDFLLLVERATIRQIGAAIKSDPRTVSKGPIYEMNKIGLLVKNGDAYSLKVL